MGILGSIMGRREPQVQYRTVDGGHPAPFPDMTDEQLYNYETTFNVERKTFDKPPSAPSASNTNGRAAKAADGIHYDAESEAKLFDETLFDAPRYTRRSTPEEESSPHPQQAEVRLPLDLSKPVRMVNSKLPVEIITTRARHPVYKVHGYIGNDNVVTVFTLDGRLSENGPRFLENVPRRKQLYLNIYPNVDVTSRDRYLLTQHETKEDAEDAAKPGRLACVTVQFDT